MANTHGVRFVLRFLAGTGLICALLVLGESQIQLGPEPYELCYDTTPPANVLVEDEYYGLIDAQKSIFPAGYSCTWALQDGTSTTITEVDAGRTSGFVVALLVGVASLAMAAITGVLSLRSSRRH